MKFLLILSLQINLVSSVNQIPVDKQDFRESRISPRNLNNPNMYNKKLINNVSFNISTVDCSCMSGPVLTRGKLSEYPMTWSFQLMIAPDRLEVQGQPIHITVW